MRHLAAYLLLVSGGNTQPTAEDITTLLSQAVIDADADRLTQLLTDLEGKDVTELYALGREKLVSSGAGGAAAAAAPAAAAGGAAAAPAAAKEAEKPKVEEVDALDGGMDMFGGGGGGGGDY